ncbi:MAG: anaerobic ribonucleoside-triphosphate reductase [Lentihominibacter sp.]
MSVTITGNADPREAQAYVEYLENKFNRKVSKLDINIDGEFADLSYELEHVPFERIRRITGYLVGTMDHWNDAKSAEERDRVKHSLGNDEMESLS